ncbi:hypothetical protein Leryth_009685 [Lithospermum erythrorhizon]|nr:hypothetical protein Leryth_009685 [Lithospermum erythrorhizon]
MFKLQRQQNKQPFTSRERVDFRFSNFQLLQVPKGWDRLLMTIISTETGKAIAKLGKAATRNGGCQWTETLLESLWIPLDNSSTETAQCYFKFIVSTGSTKPSILGEVTLNLARYVTSGVSASVSFPLKRCSYGTVMQVKIQCLTPRTQLRLEESNLLHPNGDDIETEYHEVESISNGSENSLSRSFGSSSSQNLGSTSRRGKLDRKATSSSISSSNCSFDEGSTGRVNTLPSEDECSIPNKSYFRKRALCPRDNIPRDGNEFTSAALENGTSSRNQLETAEGTTEELHAEAKMWERNARKLMIDMEVLTKEFADQSKKQADLVMELSAAYAEHGALRKEIESLKAMLVESKENQVSAADFTFQSEGKTDSQKDLADELKYQQQSNANLALQLEKSQESNIKLVSILQELEETIEQQRTEIDNLSTLHLKLNDTGSNTKGEINHDKNLSCETQQLLESEKALQINVQILEKSLEEKNKEIEYERSQTIQSLINIEKEYKYQLYLKGEEIAKLEAKLSEDHHTKVHDDVTCNNKDINAHLEKEIEELREKMMELERDCDELTEENLDLLFKLKESNASRVEGPDSVSVSTKSRSAYIDSEPVMKEDQRDGYDFELNGYGTSDGKSSPSRGFEGFSELIRQLEMIAQKIKKPWHDVAPLANEKLGCHLPTLLNVGNTYECTSDSFVNSVGSYLSELDKLLETKIGECEQKMRHGELEIQEKSSTIEEFQTKLDAYLLMVKEFDRLKSQLENDCRNLQLELSDKNSEIGELQADLLTKNQQSDPLIQNEKALQAEVINLKENNKELQENLEIAMKETEIAFKNMDNMRNNLATLAGSMDSHVSAKMVLDQQLLKLQKEKCELENQLSSMKEENRRFSQHISGLQSQLQQLVSERESYQLELDSSRDVVTSLQNDIRRWEFKIDAQRTNLEQNVQDIQKQYEESQSECSLMKSENKNLESSVVNLIEENTILKKSNTELMEKRLALHKCCLQMEARLNESQRHFLDCSRKVENLETGISSIQDTFSLGEKSLNLEIEALHEEHRKDMERLVIVENLSYQMSEELKILQQEVDDLNKKIFLINEEKKKMAFEASETLSSLLAEKSRLEQDLHSANGKSNRAETELDILRVESNVKIEGLISELDSARQSSEMLMSDHERKLMKNYRISEEKVKIAVKDHELKLTVAEYERRQLTDEVTNMKIQLQKVTELQDEITMLNEELTDCKFEKEKIETMLQSVCQSHEELKAEKQWYVDKISSMELAAADYENCRKNIITLEQKITELEDDLAANADLRNKLCDITKANEQYQLKMHKLEQEKDDLLMRVQDLQESLRLIEEKQSPFDKEDEYTSNGASPCTTEKGHPMEIMLLQNDLENSEDENKYKIQLQRFWSEGRTHVITTKKSAVGSDEEAEQRYERSKSPLETELKELQDRYFQMSLKYAEVEAQREDLVMQLKASKSAKGWFS